MDLQLLRQWIEAHRQAAARERAEQLGGAPHPEFAIRSALGLIALSGRLHGWPPREDEVTRREDEQAYGNWAKIRARFVESTGSPP